MTEEYKDPNEEWEQPVSHRTPDDIKSGTDPKLYNGREGDAEADEEDDDA